jgi:hypothetical protein
MAYQPWDIAERLKVDTEYNGSRAQVHIPWVAAESKEAVVITAAVVAELTLHNLQGAVAAKQEEKSSGPKLSGYSPGLHRFVCDECREMWDGWADEDGKLEDKRDAYCGTADCERKGHPAREVSDSDES